MVLLCMDFARFMDAFITTMAYVSMNTHFGRILILAIAMTKLMKFMMNL